MSGVNNKQEEATSKDYYFDSYAHFGIVNFINHFKIIIKIIM